MTVRSFFDTNVLIYADDKAAPGKQRRALALVAEHRRARTGVISLQVLQEYFVTVTRKLRVESSIARRKVELLAEFHVAAPDVADILAAIDLHRLHNFSFWDALVIRSADTPVSLELCSQAAASSSATPNFVWTNSAA